ncbi:MAG: DUF2256 domain-containing protein [Fuerstiella sp.]
MGSKKSEAIPDPKICKTCGLPFSWRKKWERDWPNVQYCSQRCRKQAST